MTVLAAIAVALLVIAAVALCVVAYSLAKLSKRSKGLLAQAERTEHTVGRVIDKVYRSTKELEVMLQQPEVQRALRREGRK